VVVVMVIPVPDGSRTGTAFAGCRFRALQPAKPRATARIATIHVCLLRIDLLHRVMHEQPRNRSVGHAGAMATEEVEPDVLRLARQDEADAVADLWLRSRKASFPANPASIHDDDDVHNHFATVVFAKSEVWVLDRGGIGIVALMVLDPGWIEHLHVDPAMTDRGLGSRLVTFAQDRSPEGLDLWTFQSNEGARRFYERHGFVAVEMTDGDNEEGEPDVRFGWSR
jgi:GNAT superfamily N-acetyltransferase